ncbi:hypothetical protein U1Q18_034775 [Sarracenia purpurea var. burkii]
MGKLNAASNDGEEALESFAIESRRWQEKQKKRIFKFCCPCSASKIAYKLEAAEEIKNVLKRLDQIQEEKDNFHLSAISNRKPRTVPPPSAEKIQQTSSAVFDPDIIGREDDRNRVVGLLISDEYNREGEISCLNIVGEGGLGKTTLARGRGRIGGGVK